MKNKNKVLMHEDSIIYYRGISHMAGALHRVIMALSIEGKIPQPTQSLNTEEIRYNHRFSPLLKFEGSLQSYYKYSKRYNDYLQSNEINKLYIEACQLLSQARCQFESIKDSSFAKEVIQLFVSN